MTKISIIEQLNFITEFCKDTILVKTIIAIMLVKYMHILI